MAVEFYKEFGDLGYLANYSDHGFYNEGVFYKTVEHYYQSHKFNDYKVRNMIINAATPKEASNIGRDRNYIRIEDFNKIKLSVMEEGIYLKFKNNKGIRSRLIETGSNEIREMSVKESYWGVGPNLDGENHVGLILMSVRERVKKELRDEIINNCRGKIVYVLGHKRPDTDSLVSAYVLTNILKKLGINAVFSVRDDKYVDYDVYKDNIDSEPVIVDDYNDKYFILVDHNSLDGIDSKNVIGGFDHHSITGEVTDLIEIEYASCGLLIYDLFKDIYEFSDDEKRLIYLSVITDTDFLVSKRFRDYDKSLLSELGDFDIEYFKNKYLKLTDFNGDIKDNFYNDYKEYNGNIRRSIIKSNSSDKEKYIDRYMEEMGNCSINLIIWCVYDEMSTYICFNGNIIKFPFFTTSTNLVLDYLKENGYLDNNKEYVFSKKK